jgi:hypothetical protein
MNLRVLIALAIIAILATAAYGFAAGNTVQKSRAGDGSGVISGYTITNISYQLDTTDPGLIAGVTFDTNVAATTVKAQLTANGSWYPCTGSNNNLTWTCAPVSPASETTVTSANPLRVVAVQ